jgi:hypothetical protein
VRLVEDPGRCFERRAGSEGCFSGQHLEQHAAEREDVCAPIDRLAPQLFRRHVGRRSEHGSRLRQTRVAGRVVRAHRPLRDRREAEVEDLRVARTREEDVLGLDVAVHDPFLVRRAERVEDLAGDRQRVGDRQAPPAQALAERFSFEKLGDDERAAGVVPDVVDGENPRVGQGGDGARLALEPGERQRVKPGMLGKGLDCDETIQPRVVRAVDLAHSAGADPVENPVRPELRASRDRHDVRHSV